MCFLRVGGLLFLAVGAFFLVMLVPEYLEENTFKRYSTVVEGIVIRVRDNRDSVTHWKYSSVILHVQYQYSADSLAIASRSCISGGTSYQPDNSCAGVGTSKKVRFIPSENSDKVTDPGWTYISDSGDFYRFTSMWSLVLPFAACLVGVFLLWVGFVGGKD